MFECNPLWSLQPVQLTKVRSDVLEPRRGEDEPREQSVQNVVLVPQNPLEQIVVHIFNEYGCAVSVRISEWHSPERTPRRITASTRCRSAAVAKPHLALAAYVSLAMSIMFKNTTKNSIYILHSGCERGYKTPLPTSTIRK